MAQAAALAPILVPPPRPYVRSNTTGTEQFPAFKELLDGVKNALPQLQKTTEELSIALLSKAAPREKIAGHYEKWQQSVVELKKNLASQDSTIRQLWNKIPKLNGPQAILFGFENVPPMLLQIHFMKEEANRLGELFDSPLVKQATKSYKEKTYACEQCLKTNGQVLATLSSLSSIFKEATREIDTQRLELNKSNYPQTIVQHCRDLHLGLIEFIEARTEVLANQIDKKTINDTHPLTELRRAIIATKESYKTPVAYPSPQRSREVKPPPEFTAPENIESLVNLYRATFGSAPRTELNFRQANAIEDIIESIKHWKIRDIVGKMKKEAAGLQRLRDDIILRLEMLFRGNISPQHGCKSLKDEVCLYRVTLQYLISSLRELEKEIRTYALDTDVHTGVNYASGLLAYAQKLSEKLDFLARLLQEKYFSCLQVQERLRTYAKQIPKEPISDLQVVITQVTNLYEAAAARRSLPQALPARDFDFIATYRKECPEIIEQCIANLGFAHMETMRPKNVPWNMVLERKPLWQIAGLESKDVAMNHLPLNLKLSILWEILKVYFPEDPPNPLLNIIINLLESQPEYFGIWSVTNIDDSIFHAMVQRFQTFANTNVKLTPHALAIGDIYSCFNIVQEDGPIYSRIYHYARGIQLLENISAYEAELGPLQPLYFNAKKQAEEARKITSYPSMLYPVDYHTRKGTLIALHGGAISGDFQVLLLSMLCKALWSDYPKQPDQDMTDKQEARQLLRLFYSQLKPEMLELEHSRQETYKMRDPGHVKFIMALLEISDVLDRKQQDMTDYDKFLLYRALIDYVKEDPDKEDWTNALRQVVGYGRMEYVLFITLKKLKAQAIKSPTAMELINLMKVRGIVRESSWATCMGYYAEWVELADDMKKQNGKRIIESIEAYLNHQVDRDHTERELLEDKYRESVDACLADINAFLKKP